MSDIPEGIQEITDGTIDDFINNEYDLPVFIDLWAEWCMPCKRIAPVIKQLEEEYRGQMLFAKLDVDNNTETASKYQITSIPRFIIFYNGQVRDSFVGALAKEKFKQKIDQVLEEIEE